MNTAEYFQKNKYIYLSNVINRSDCEELTNYMFKLFDDGKLIKDDQCPLSDAIYGDPIFDKLLQ